MTYEIQTSTDQGRTWTTAATETETDAAWDIYCDLSVAHRVRLLKNRLVISTSHIDDAH